MHSLFPCSSFRPSVTGFEPCTIALEDAKTRCIGEKYRNIRHCRVYDFDDKVGMPYVRWGGKSETFNGAIVLLYRDSNIDRFAILITE